MRQASGYFRNGHPQGILQKHRLDGVDSFAMVGSAKTDGQSFGAVGRLMADLSRTMCLPLLGRVLIFIDDFGKDSRACRQLEEV